MFEAAEPIVSEPVLPDLEGFAIPGINVPWIKLDAVGAESHPTNEGQRALEKLPTYLEAFNGVTCKHGLECQRRGLEPVLIIKQFGHEMPSGTQFVAGRELIFALVSASSTGPDVDIGLLKMMAQEIQQEAQRILSQTKR